MKTRDREFSAVLLSVLLCAACSSAPRPSMRTTAGALSDAAAIRSARMEQNRAMADGAPDRAAEFWTEDVTLRRGLGASVAGRDAYRQLMEADLKSPARMIYERTPLDVEVSDRWPLAFESGRWTARLVSAPAVHVITGRYSAQWVRRNGRWLIRSEVFVALTCEASGCSAVAAP